MVCFLLQPNDKHLIQISLYDDVVSTVKRTSVCKQWMEKYPDFRKRQLVQMPIEQRYIST